MYNTVKLHVNVYVVTSYFVVDLREAVIAVSLSLTVVMQAEVLNLVMEDLTHDSPD